METVPANLYDYPRYYDLVFGSDWKPECDFLEAVFEQHVPGKTKRLFEPACGTGRLIYRLIARGYSVSGLDLNPHAVAYCNKRLARHGYKETAFVGDMTKFTLPRPVDAAFNTINSFRHLQTEAQAVAHLKCVADCLRKGGVYALGLHLTPTVGDPLTEERWSARRGHLCINTHLATFETDLKKRTERCRMQMDVYSPTQQFQIVDELVFRTYTLPQILSLIKKEPRFTIAATYDFAYKINRPIELSEDTQDVVFVLQRG